MPPPDLELSTYNINDLEDAAVWAIGDSVRTEQGKDTLYGRADLIAERVYSVGLRPVRDDPPPRHVVIVGWPEKALHKAKAQLLAAASEFTAK